MGGWTGVTKKENRHWHWVFILDGMTDLLSFTFKD